MVSLAVFSFIQLCEQGFTDKQFTNRAQSEGQVHQTATAEWNSCVSCLVLFQRSIGLPDVHSGYGFAIGNMAAFDMNDPEAVVSPGKELVQCGLSETEWVSVHFSISFSDFLFSTLKLIMEK